MTPHEMNAYAAHYEQRVLFAAEKGLLDSEWTAKAANAFIVAASLRARALASTGAAS